MTDTGFSPVTVAYRVPGLGVIRVKGQDSIKVISGLCTAKLQDMAIGAATEAFFTDDRGRVLAHAIVARDSEGAWIVGQLTQPAELAAHIDRFIFREDATPRDVTAEVSAWLVDGSAGVSRLAQLAETDSADLNNLGTGFFSLDSTPVQMVRLPITSPNAVLCWVAADQGAVLEQALTQAGFLTQAAGDEFETRRIANFWPVIGREINERTLPQELDRDKSAISFTKGCYLGQETVARLDALGEVQKKLCLVQMVGAATAEAGQSLTRDGKEVGKLTSIAPIATHGHILALGYMRRGAFAVGTAFELGNSAGTVIAHS